MAFLKVPKASIYKPFIEKWWGFCRLRYWHVSNTGIQFIRERRGA
jgi:hypothetical protein